MTFSDLLALLLLGGTVAASMYVGRRLGEAVAPDVARLARWIDQLARRSR